MAERPQGILDYGAWSARMGSLAAAYAQARPFPHIVLHDLLLPEVASRLEREFPPLESGGWTHYEHVNEHKQGKSRREEIPPFLLSVIDELNDKGFRELLTKLTGVDGLLPDPEFRAGGGLSQCGPGGFLNIHTDFTVHPYHPTWRRRVNLIFYLNNTWDERWGGHTELWDAGMRGAVVKVAPVVNTALVFNSDGLSYHGHPEPLRSPEGVARRTLALYYFSEESNPISLSTRYVPRPEDGWLRRILIQLDQLALRAYHALKQRLGLSDRLASRLLELLSGRSGRSR